MARKAVVSNASVWDTQHLLPGSPGETGWRQEAMQTPMTGSFMHLHLGEALPCTRRCARHHCSQLKPACLQSAGSLPSCPTAFQSWSSWVLTFKQPDWTCLGCWRCPGLHRTTSSLCLCASSYAGTPGCDSSCPPPSRVASGRLFLRLVCQLMQRICTRIADSDSSMRARPCMDEVEAQALWAPDRLNLHVMLT